MDIQQHFLDNARKLFLYYRTLGDKTIAQLNYDELQWQTEEEANSIAIIVKHMSGNMLSRWTDFLTADGEKSWRHRDQEFIDTLHDKQEVVDCWNKGWDCVFDALNPLTGEDMTRTIYIRGEGHSIVEAIQRQMTHYAYHVGQMIVMAKMMKGKDWQSLSIPRGKSEEFNKETFKIQKSNFK